MDTNRGDNYSEATFVTLVPPPVPKTRGPSLAAGRRKPGGPPRSTPTRASRRYYLSSGLSGAGILPLPVQAQMKRLIPQAAGSGNTAWSGESVVAESAPSLSCDFMSESSTIVGEQKSITFEMEQSRSPGGELRRASPLIGPEAELQRALEAMEETPLPGLYVPRTSTTAKSSRQRSSSSLCFEVVDSSHTYDEYDDDESLPSALPPPTPHPVVRSAAASQVGVRPTKLGLDKDVARDMFASPRGRNTARGARCMDDGGTVGKYKRHTASGREISESAPPGRPAFAPAPVLLQSHATYLLNELDALGKTLNGVEDTNCYKLYLMSTEKALQGIQREIEALLRTQEAVDGELLAAKARQLESHNGKYAKKGSVAHEENAKNKGSNAAGERHLEEDRHKDADDDAEMTHEEEAWRIEKGELLAEKALLLQKRKELCYHLRRGTNIKNVAALAFSEGNARNKADGPANNSYHVEVESHAKDLETLHLHLELKGAQVQFMKLADSHQNLQGSQRKRVKEFEDECVRLRLSVNAAREEAGIHRGALEATLRRAEELRGRCRENDKEPLLMLLEQRMEEARAALRPHEDKLAHSGSFLSRRSSASRASTGSLRVRRLSGPSGSPTSVVPKVMTSAGPTSS
ncbi:hypothetical protein TraAM80_01723 [Trypanosoma rangeli]|uniref:Uncharacterized protein n=1 Tax=Trypanosoma rangeli TaxID=5698 RepID=A0A3R7NQR4_TRYRA|nr:uncharacterized protein TraAM80_01723 [Trypanosoma rangeli]RNF10147.1 hypothetical protein TraAM80_01723 [Trypanosoma rangeli]|eukprot:RNF10147.1 hypothetical protein TraAM80_01723 [Trypanosoma rangeli]